jgi:hypothetical protein
MKRTGPSEAFAPLPARITVRVPLTIHRRGGRKRIITPVGFHHSVARPARIENAVVKALAKAFRWRSMIESGQYSSITELAKAEKINESYACRILRLTLLAPPIVETLLNREGISRRFSEVASNCKTSWHEQMNQFCTDGSIAIGNGMSSADTC